jgi:hypothetical protein
VAVVEVVLLPAAPLWRLHQAASNAECMPPVEACACPAD